MKLRVDIRIDVQSFKASVQAQTAENPQQFDEALRAPLKLAAREAIKGNFLGQGKYSPRPIAKFTSRQSGQYRGWVEGKHGSDRARMQQQVDQEKTQEVHAQKQYLRNRIILQGVQKAGQASPAFHQMAQQAATISANAKGAHNPRQQFQAAFLQKQQQSSPQLQGFLRNSQKGQDMVKDANQKVRKIQAGKMRFGVQTGLLQKAWYDPGVQTSTQKGSLSYSLSPSSKHDTPHSPTADRLTRDLERPKGGHGSWRGLLDRAQLVEALRDQGVIIL